MQTFIQKAYDWLRGQLRIGLQRARESSPAPVPDSRRFEVLPEYVEWTADDILKLRAFFASDTGQRLVKVCGSAIHVEAMAESGGDRTVKKAFGMDALLRFQFNLASDKEFARATGDQVAKPDTIGSEEDDALPVEFRRSF